jgi:hypothetical protein
VTAAKLLGNRRQERRLGGNERRPELTAAKAVPTATPNTIPNATAVQGRRETKPVDSSTACCEMESNASPSTSICCFAVAIFLLSFTRNAATASPPWSLKVFRSSSELETRLRSSASAVFCERRTFFFVNIGINLQWKSTYSHQRPTHHSVPGPAEAVLARNLRATTP